MQDPGSPLDILRRFAVVIICTLVVLSIYGYRTWLYYQPVVKPPNPYAGYISSFRPSPGQNVTVGPLNTEDIYPDPTAGQMNFGYDTPDVNLWQYLNSYGRSGSPASYEHIVNQGHVIELPPGTIVQFLDFDSAGFFYKVSLAGRQWYVWHNDVYISPSEFRPESNWGTAQ